MKSISPWKSVGPIFILIILKLYDDLPCHGSIFVICAGHMSELFQSGSFIELTLWIRNSKAYLYDCDIFKGSGKEWSRLVKVVFRLPASAQS